MNVLDAEKIEVLMKMRRSVRDMINIPNDEYRKKYDAVEFEDMCVRHFIDGDGSRGGYGELNFILPFKYYDFMLKTLEEKIEKDLADLGVEV